MLKCEINRRIITLRVIFLLIFVCQKGGTYLPPQHGSQSVMAAGWKMESAFYGRAESLPAGETNKTEISEKGKPSERMGRKATGPKATGSSL